MPSSGQNSQPPSRPPIVFKDDIKRRLMTQPLADAVVILRGTVLPQEERNHFYIAEAPLTPGLNPLLLVIEEPSGRREFRNVLAVLPKWRIHTSPCDSTFYLATLGRVRAKYKTIITELQPSNLGEILPAHIVDGRHCGDGAPPWLTKLVGLLIDDASQCEDVSPRIISEISELLECKPHDDPEEVPWNVLHLHSDKPDPNVDPDWFIFENWDSWTTRGLSSKECFSEFSLQHNKPAGPSAFTEHLRYLGLPVPLKPGIKRRRKRGFRLAQARQET